MYDDVFAAFEEAGIRYVVVGGIAVVLSGHLRATVDLDVVIDLQADAARAAVRALQRLGLEPAVPVDPLSLGDPDVRSVWVEDKHMTVLSFHDPRRLGREVDVFVAYPLDFEELVQAAVHRDVHGRAVPVASVDHLIQMKRAVGRPRDLEDVAALERLRRPQ